MSRVPFIVIDGKPYRWKDILEQRRAQLAAAGAAQASQEGGPPDPNFTTLKHMAHNLIRKAPGKDRSSSTSTMVLRSEKETTRGQKTPIVLVSEGSILGRCLPP
jgi:hypothetical protein